MLHFLGVIGISNGLKATLVPILPLSLDEEWSDEEIYDILADLAMEHRLLFLMYLDDLREVLRETPQRYRENPWRGYRDTSWEVVGIPIILPFVSLFTGLLGIS